MSAKEGAHSAPPEDGASAGADTAATGAETASIGAEKPTTVSEATNAAAKTDADGKAATEAAAKDNDGEGVEEAVRVDADKPTANPDDGHTWHFKRATMRKGFFKTVKTREQLDRDEGPGTVWTGFMNGLGVNPDDPTPVGPDPPPAPKYIPWKTNMSKEEEEAELDMPDHEFIERKYKQVMDPRDQLVDTFPFEQWPWKEDQQLIRLTFKLYTRHRKIFADETDPSCNPHMNESTRDLSLCTLIDSYFDAWTQLDFGRVKGDILGKEKVA